MALTLVLNLVFYLVLAPVLSVLFDFVLYFVLAFVFTLPFVILKQELQFLTSSVYLQTLFTNMYRRYLHHHQCEYTMIVSGFK